MGKPKDLPRYTIIGVVADGKYTGVRESDTPIASFPYQQALEVGTIHYDRRSTLLTTRAWRVLSKPLAERS